MLNAYPLAQVALNDVGGTTASATPLATSLASPLFGNPLLYYPTQVFSHNPLRENTTQWGTPTRGFYDRYMQVTAAEPSTRFGVPFCLDIQVFIEWQTGWVQREVTTRFGTPQGVYEQTTSATGTTATAFGTALRPALLATGLNAAKFGTPALSQHYVTSHLPARYGRPAGFTLKLTYIDRAFWARPVQTTRFGTHGASFDRTMSAQPWVASRFGRARTTRLTATGLNSTRFGTQATSSFDQIGTPLRIPSARFGTPRAGYDGVHVARGRVLTRFGKPTEPYRRATSLNRTRFGTKAVAIYDKVPQAPGLYTTRFGRPRWVAGRLFNATGVHTTQYGVTSSYTTYRALHVPPSTRFGKPLLRRVI